MNVKSDAIYAMVKDFKKRVPFTGWDCRCVWICMRMWQESRRTFDD